MTNFRKATSNAKRPHNQKDGIARSRSQAAQYEADGFKQAGWNRWEYTWEGDFPVFQLAPGILEDRAGLIAKFGEDIKIHFPYGTNPAVIKAQLDDEILAIMRHGAEIAEWPLDLDWINIDEWMVA